MLNRYSGYLSGLVLLGLLSSSLLAEVEVNTITAISNQNLDQARVIVKLRPEASLARRHAMSATTNPSESENIAAARAQALSSRANIQLKSGRPISEHAQVVTGSGLSSAELAARLARDPDVEYAVADQRRAHMLTPTDPYFAAGPTISGGIGGPAVGQWYLHAPTDRAISSINAQSIWDFSMGNSSVVVAILDTGVRFDHPDLANRLLQGYDMVSEVATANDGDGRDGDPSDPGDWVTPSEANNSNGTFYQCDASNSSWHGTHMASVIGAASNNSIGMAGVAWGVSLLPVRVLGKCGGYDSDIIAGMNWAAGLTVPGIPNNQTPAKVISLSLGGTGTCPQSYVDTIHSITSKADPAVIVVSAGNTSGRAVTTPGNCPGVVTVGGLRHAGTKVGFSDLGPEIAISAPAGNCVNTNAAEPCLYPILAASNKGLTTPAGASYTDSFNFSLGTSYSVPLVSGTVALMLSINPELTPEEVKSLLQTSARPFPVPTSNDDPILSCQSPSAVDQLECYCTTTTCGAGMLDTKAAVMASGPFPIYRFFNNNSGGHFFTISESEKNTVIKHYPWFRYEGVGFYAHPTQQPGTLPIHRFFNNLAGGHFFTISDAEKNTVLNNYNWFRYEGTGFYAFPMQHIGSLPVHRFFNNNAGGHFFTISDSEKNTVINDYNWFRYEGIGFYALP